MEKKIFLSADIEGTCGIAHWDETEPEKQDYAFFSQQMSREVAAACEGFLAAGASHVFIRDAHNTARNIHTDMLPDSDKLEILRGWARDPYGMMSALDETYAGVAFTGYHSASSWSGNPLSHTMNTENTLVQINGEDCSELMMNCMTAAMLKVPVLLVCGDQMLCDFIQSKIPGVKTVPVSCGLGNGSISIMPGEAVRRIRKAAEEAAAMDASGNVYPMPDHFTVDIHYRKHFNARAKSWYPGAKLVSQDTVRFECDDWFDALTFLHFCL